MQPVKQEALNTIGQLPEDVDMDEIMYRLYVVDKIRKGQQAVEDNQTISHEDTKKEIDKLCASFWYWKYRQKKALNNYDKQASFHMNDITGTGQNR